MKYIGIFLFCIILHNLKADEKSILNQSKESNYQPISWIKLGNLLEKLTPNEKVETLKNEINKNEEWCKEPNTGRERLSSCLSELRTKKDELVKLEKEYNFQKERTDTLSNGKNCENDSYKTCYMGKKWGSSVEDICTNEKLIPLKDTNWSENTFYHTYMSCDAYVIKNLPNLDQECAYKNCSLEFSNGKNTSPGKSCFAITMNEKLTGFYKEWSLDLKDPQINAEEKFYALLGLLKSKYGKDVEKSTCKDLETFYWKNTESGLNILLLKKLDKTSNRLELFLRYINKETFDQATNQQIDSLKKNHQQMEKEKNKELDNFGSGI